MQIRLGRRGTRIFGGIKPMRGHAHRAPRLFIRARARACTMGLAAAYKLNSSSIAMPLLSSLPSSGTPPIVENRRTPTFELTKNSPSSGDEDDPRPRLASVAEEG